MSNFTTHERYADSLTEAERADMLAAVLALPPVEQIWLDEGLRTAWELVKDDTW
jgi:hypothetical protein